MLARTAISANIPLPGDRTVTTGLYLLEAQLHLELVRRGPSPALLRALAAVDARLNGGAR